MDDASEVVLATDVAALSEIRLLPECKNMSRRRNISAEIGSFMGLTRRLATSARPIASSDQLRVYEAAFEFVECKEGRVWNSLEMTAEAPVFFTNEYRGLAKGLRYEHWREEICRGLCNIDIDPSRDDVIDMQCRIANLDPVAIASAVGTSATIGRSPATTGDGGDDFTFVFDPGTRMPFRHRDEIFAIAPSEMMLGDLRQPSAATLSDCHSFSALVVNREALIKLCPHADSALYSPFRVAPELNALISNYTRLASEAAPNVDAYGRFLMGQHLIDLVALALGTQPDVTELTRQRGYAQARLALIKSHVQANLHKPQFSVERVAQRYGLGERQIQRLFEHEGMTFTEFLLEQRLIAMRRLLADTKNAGRRIAELAHTVGFTDLSHFNRAFRRRFGETPSDMRARATEGDGRA